MKINITVDVADSIDGDMLEDIFSKAGEAAAEHCKDNDLEVDEQVDLTDFVHNELSYLNPAREALIEVLLFRSE